MKAAPCYRVVPDPLVAGRVNLHLDHIPAATAEELIVALNRLHPNMVEGNVSSVSRLAIDVVKRALHRITKQRKPRCRTTTLPWQPMNQYGNELALLDGLIYKLRKDDSGSRGWHLRIEYDNDGGNHDAPHYAADGPWQPNRAGWQWFFAKRDALDTAQHVATVRAREMAA